MNTTPATPVRPSVWFSLGRSLATIGLALALTLIIALFVIGYLPIFRETFDAASSSGSKLLKTVAALVALFLVFLPLGLTVVASRKGWLTWKVLTAGWIIVLPVLAWLSWDEAIIRYPLPIEEFSPAFPGAEQSYAVLMQYSRQTPSKEAKDFSAMKMTVSWSGASPREPAKWREFVAKNRAGIEADWAALAPQRRWLDELGAFERFGDLTPSLTTANHLTFEIWRTLAQRACAFATLQALDGHGDDAVAILLPMLEAGIKLQPSSRTLVRSMVAVVVERMCLETAGILLDLAPVSAASRARLLAALGPDNAGALARRLILSEYVLFAPVLHDMRLGDQVTHQGARLGVLRGPFNFLSGLLLNPNATTNVYGQYVFELAALAEARDLGKFAVQSQGFGDTLFQRPGMKNLVGRLIITMAVPSYKKVIESFWVTADLRTALRKRLAS